MALERVIQEYVDRGTIEIVSAATDMRGSPGRRSVQDVVEPLYNAVMTALRAGS